MDDSIRSNNIALTNQISQSSNANLKHQQQQQQQLAPPPPPPPPSFEQTHQIYSFYHQNPSNTFQYTAPPPPPPAHQPMSTQSTASQFNYINIPQTSYFNYQTQPQQQQHQLLQPQLYQNIVPQTAQIYHQYTTPNYQNISFLNPANTTNALNTPNLYYHTTNSFLPTTNQQNLYHNYYTNQPQTNIDLNLTQNSLNSSIQKSPNTQHLLNQQIIQPSQAQQAFISYVQSPSKIRKQINNFNTSTSTNTNTNTNAQINTNSNNANNNTTNNDDITQNVNNLSDTSSLLDNFNDSSLLSSSSTKRSSANAILPIPKYIKPKICKSPLVIHSVVSRRVLKPKPQFATVPPEPAKPMIEDQLPHLSEYIQQNLRPQISQPPPPPLPPLPPPSLAPALSTSTTSSNPPAPATLTNYDSSILSQSPSKPSLNYSIVPPPPPPPPPMNRPASPPNQPPSVQRPNLFSSPSLNQRPLLPPPPTTLPPPPPSIPPQIPPYNSKPTTKNILLNQILNNSLNTDKGSSKNYDYDSSFNNSASSANNNSVFNNTGTTNTNNDENLINYQQLLMSPNLYTFFDRKKQPPPPYPGKTAEQTDQLMETTVSTLTPSQIPPYEQALNEANKQLQQQNQYQLPQQSNGSSNSSFLSSCSTVRTCSPQAFKFFMEQHAENVLKHHKAREYRRLQLESEMQKASLPEEVRDQMRKLLRQKETNYLRLRRAKMNKSMFEHIKTLGIGAFGQVDLVRKRDDPQRLYAMKILHKSDVFNRNQAAHVKAERDILAEADNEWVVKLYYSFQDDENLYFVMDYVPGGDLMNLLIKKQIFSEKLAQFYIGELTCAIESVHNLGFIHRDIKPDNILIDRNGHIKLTDFGLCTGFHWTHNSQNYIIDDTYSRILEKKINKMQTNPTNDRRLMAHSLVGTPNYIAPEILSRKGYTKSCDWWSVGVILYEMLVGEPPFRDESALGTQAKVINWRQTLQIPEGVKISPDAKDLIFKLCTDSETRLGADGIKMHPFFKGFDFGPNLRRSEAPYKPSIKHPTDTSNFEPIDISVLADRKARIDQMNRTRLQQQSQLLQMQSNRFMNSNNLYNSNFKSGYSDLNSSLTNNSVNPILYEFTFRRFFDEVYLDPRHYNAASTEIEIENDSDHSNSFRYFISANNQLTKNDTNNSEKMDYNTEPLSDKPLSPTITNMMASVTTKSPPQIINDENSLSYQTDKLIDHTKKIQLKESTNFNCYTTTTDSLNENTIDGKETSKPPIYI